MRTPEFQCKLRLNRHLLRTMIEWRSERNWKIWKAYFVLAQGHRARTWQSLNLNSCLFSSKVHALSTGGSEQRQRGAIILRKGSSKYHRRALRPTWEYESGKAFWRRWRCLLIDFRKREEGRERETSICCSTYLRIHWLLLVCALTGIEPSTLEYALIQWATWPWLEEETFELRLKGL